MVVNGRNFIKCRLHMIINGILAKNYLTY